MGWGLLWIGVLRDIGWNTAELRLFPLPWYVTWAPIAMGAGILAIVGARHVLKTDWSTAESAIPQEPS
jgi:hypothetical protein